MRTIPSVSFKVEKWNPGTIDIAWSWITGIRYEKRSIPNTCYVASKVGLPLEVDEQNLYKNDFVRVKI